MEEKLALAVFEFEVGDAFVAVDEGKAEGVAIVGDR